MRNCGPCSIFRSIIWLQRRRDEIMERLRGSTHQQHRDDLHELQIGRLKQDRVHIPRGGEVSNLNYSERGLSVYCN